MKPVKQTRHGKTDGNCFAACVASLLGVELKEIDELLHPTETDSDWFKPLQKYLRKHHLTFVNVSLKHGWPMSEIPSLYVIASGMNHKHTCRHSVVAKIEGATLQMVHDPSGVDEPLATVDSIGFLARI
jgi:hypothetical protein